jgi:sporulation integral membrane protein YtvI
MAIPTFALEFFKRTPKAILTLVVTVLASFYFAIDYDAIKDRVLYIFKGRAGDVVRKSYTVAAKALKSYAKAYLLLMLITFIEVFIGLLLLKRSYAFIIAIGVAVVDVLPFFGTGAVLVPWAIISFIIGDHGVGSGLLVLYGVVTIVRQVLEPRIVGANLGIHPLATLFSMFAGLSFFGFFGMLLGPLVFLVIREVLSEQKTR